MDAERVTRIRATLLEWFATSRRDLPFRRDRHPYRVLVAEVMLQQTRVQSALPYVARFLEAYPTPERLARAPESAVLRLWQGLGYYGRARRLHAAAHEIVTDHGGEVPADPGALRALPGVGPYIAAAVGSLAFGRDEPAIDANAVRVIARLARIVEPVDGPPGKRQVARLADTLLPRGRAGEWNEALMDFGALVCTPRVPRCGECPVSGDCLAAATGLARQLPRRRPRRASPEVDVACVLARRGGRIAVVRRPGRGLLAGMWEFPSVEGEREPDAVYARFGLRPSAQRALPELRHVFTHRVWRLRAWEVDIAGDLDAAREGRWGADCPAAPADADGGMGEAGGHGTLRWVAPAELAALPLTGPTARLAAGAGVLPAKSLRGW